MSASKIWCVLAAVATLLKTISAEDCINLEEHKDEILGCCKYQPPYPRDDVEECIKQSSEKAGGDQHELMTCLFECYFSALGIVSGNTINEDKIAEHMQSLDENARNILLAGYKECAAKTTGAQRACNSFALDTEICVIQMLEQQCPDEYYNPSEICDKLKAGAEICH